ncbi:Alpha/Beta hydrolase protein [Rhexocercosporidium sp. MPI-PUGE-AT-0058]|nr:Alpha/Beta hydrolase protein [Rhexocercosporidium sp. MPI-PUGE-AT-0058]
MKLSLISSITILFSGVLSHSTCSDIDTRTCQEYTIPVNVTSQVFIASYPRFKDNFDVVQFFTTLGSRSSLVPFSGAKNVTAAYSIGATICSPCKSTRKEKTLLLASHGLGYDRRYWDSGVEAANYSFVDFAISRGYSVFSYDRLGTGKSSKVSGYDVPQSTTQLAILQQLTSLVRNGNYTSAFGRPSKLVHIGHSYGSQLSNGLIATTPGLSDGVILTGLSYGETSGSFLKEWGFRIAELQAPGKWPGRDNNYVTGVDIYGNTATFFHGDSYSKKIARYNEDLKQPVASIELLTFRALPQKAPMFSKPLMVIAGEFDAAFCDGNCTGILAPLDSYFPNATDFQAVVHPAVGHGINFSYNATGAYTVMLDYLKKHGL